MTEYKPVGYPALSPYLTVEDSEASMRFIEAVFGGQRLRMHKGDSGDVMHGEMRVGGAVLMFTDAKLDWPALPAHLHIYVEDVDATFASALEYGATEIQKPVQKDDSDKRGGVLAPGGVHWWIATMVDPE